MTPFYGRFLTSLLVTYLTFSATTGIQSVHQGVARIHTCTELFSDRSSIPPLRIKGVSQLPCLWEKKTLKVRFLRGDPIVQAKVIQHAREWEKYSGVVFVFGNASDADIRITFDTGRGSNSYVGSCQPKNLGQSEATMNFGWLTRTTSDSEYNRVVVHEFGHALGLVHEHQSPAADIQWDSTAAYAYYWQTEGWDRSKVDEYVFKKYSTSETNHTTYDPQSIMEYPIPKELTRNGFEVGWNYDLSQTDKVFIREQYSGR